MGNIAEYVADQLVAGSLAVLSARIVLDDADLRALGSGPITIVPAPGVGKALCFHCSVWETNIAVAYTAETSPLIAVTNSDAGGMVSNPIAGATDALMVPINGIYQAFECATIGINAFAGALLNNTCLFDNAPLKVKDYNAAALTGGDITNQITITVFYSIIDLA